MWIFLLWGKSINPILGATLERPGRITRVITSEVKEIKNIIVC
ncbi:MAG: hypothetical protein JETT_1239 [Candidatus Jettenia ecosi]|uniref:Uncharacterized protein n=1 Tax=Candidatus Jettenia ecosi TaxID=2494326 RepID=A0A533QCD4_9BACT|nr:MAG: hypothetical protein JETT_1239 [Candidatus Jettenia ecosi]